LISIAHNTMKKQIIACSFAALFFSSCQEMKTDVIAEPVALKVPHVHTEHDVERLDPYYWMRDRENPEVVAYLEDENSYREAIMKGTEALQETIYQEIFGRIKQDDQSVPYMLNGYLYYSRYEKGGEYPIHCRKKGGASGVEEIMLDVNIMAEGHAFYQVAALNVSPDNNLLAFAVDSVGRRIYTIFFKNLETGEILKDQLPYATGSMGWASDSKTLFYTQKDLTTLRSNKIFRHQLGDPDGAEHLIFEETDETFNTYVYTTKSRQFLVIGSGSTVSTEFRVLPADQPLGDFQVFQPRQRDLEYSISHFEDHWYIRTNAQGATNFKLMRCPVGKTGLSNWKDVIAHREDVLFEGMELFKSYLVLEERQNGLTQIRIRRWDTGAEHYLDFGEETYSAGTGANMDFDTKILRYGYTSMTTPSSVYDYNMETREKLLLKQQEVVGGYDPQEYETKRLWATAADGKKVPMSVVYKKGIVLNGDNPLLLYGYGSYGAIIDPGFSVSRLSLLDRGFVFVIAHIRGGEYLGRPWYEDGKLLNKINTFSDFISCAEHLIANGYTRPAKLFAMGGSAGGLLMGAVVNMRPDLFRGIVAQVPFVDVVTTMLDDQIPLTTGEYDEWGNPNDRKYFEYMLSYSPYDNVKAQDYPAMLITAGFHDSQVQYWEPAKWVARLRELRTNKEPLLFYCNMETGHGGASGRFKAIRETAMEYAFLVDLARDKR
jgi:oligopeptidase B